MKVIVLTLVAIVLCSGQLCVCPQAGESGPPWLASLCGQPSSEQTDETDLCPDDPDKTEPGQCGCGRPETDTDSDGTPDCVDGCLADPFKTEAGQCGCGTPETDTDNDGTPDCLDQCPEHAGKTVPGICGCALPDTDVDSDGIADCLDLCPQDPDKTAPGGCGCGIADVDTDGDGVFDCIDNCPDVTNPTQGDWNANGQGDACDAPEGASIVANDGQSLGILNRQLFDVNSISSAYGPYGDASSDFSLWNPDGTYGSNTGALSPWNSSTTTPPTVVYQGSQIAYLTTNPTLSPAIHPNDVATFIGRNDLRR